MSVRVSVDKKLLEELLSVAANNLTVSVGAQTVFAVQQDAKVIQDEHDSTGTSGEKAVEGPANKPSGD